VRPVKYRESGARLDSLLPFRGGEPKELSLAPFPRAQAGYEGGACRAAVAAMSGIARDQVTGLRYSADMPVARATIAAVMVAALAACSHAMPSDPEHGATPVADSDPWRVKGSVSAGPMTGTPQGPYGSRP
jgi:hypothetical protein